MGNIDQIDEHEEKLSITVEMVVPAHPQRVSETTEFNHSVARLKADGHYQCWVCGSLDELQVHHAGCEWSEQNNCNFDQLKTTCMARDYYGYSHSEEFKDVPITSVDDIRNLVVLCQDHHTGTSDTKKTGTGIHNMPEPYWLMQKNGKANPIIEDGETIADVEKRVD